MFHLRDAYSYLSKCKFELEFLINNELVQKSKQKQPSVQLGIEQAQAAGVLNVWVPATFEQVIDMEAFAQGKHPRIERLQDVFDEQQLKEEEAAKQEEVNRQQNVTKNQQSAKQNVVNNNSSKNNSKKPQQEEQGAKQKTPHSKPANVGAALDKVSKPSKMKTQLQQQQQAKKPIAPASSSQKKQQQNLKFI